ncbi:response regulator transcription factor [Psychrobacter sp. Ps3]|uniref:response regulator n=1 Tax=Psychrobacter sp. Ps3 TaxID=2790957 RepID=UPI001EE04EC8|nr:response regulator transcription factor [Psychrobacter sp. Ps3]MCG3881492.1 response regulator transcription factor [Psychrobacter sp. Ps3]
MKTRKIVLLVDDHALFRAGLRLILKNKIDAEIIEIEKISDVTSLTEEVDVILLDICLPGLNGIDGMAILQQHWPKARIMLLSATNNHEEINRALELGACCFLHKNSNSTLICNTVQSLLMSRLPSKSESFQTPHSPIVIQAKTLLSTRLLEVLALIAEGHSNKYIADKLSLSENTVRNHIATLMDHFEVHNRTKIIIAAQQAGYLARPE